MNIGIRVDASAEIGLGHFMRCLTLADELSRRGNTVIFFIKKLSDEIIKKIIIAGHHFFIIQDESDGYRDKIAVLGMHTISNVSRIVDDSDLKDLFIKLKLDWLIVDSYYIGARWETGIKNNKLKILVIDDMPNRRHECEILLDQNFYTDPHGLYENLVSKTCRVLIGPKYALIRPQFNNRRIYRMKHNGFVNKIVVMFGGSDPSNETVRVLQALNFNNNFKGKIDIIMGSLCSHKNEIISLIEGNKNVRLFIDLDDVADILVQSDLCFGGGGSSSWERCCLGLPTIAVQVADNQRDILRNLESIDVLINLGNYESVTIEDYRIALRNVTSNPDWLLRSSQNSMALVDGLGCSRIVSEMYNFSH